jgi:beta-amyrin synthase
LQFLTEKNFKQTIPQVKVEDGEEITYEKATAALRRAIHFFSALQASDGHWPAENAGVLFFLPPLVRLIIIINLLFSFIFYFLFFFIIIILSMSSL